MTDPSSSRRLVYCLLIVLAVGTVCGRIVSTTRVYEPGLHRAEGEAPGRRPAWPAVRPQPLPLFGSNDRSRWATVRALVDEGTYVIGRRDRTLVVVSAVAPLGGNGPVGIAALTQFGYVCRTTRGDKGIIFEDGWQSVDKVLHPSSLVFYSTKPPLFSTLVAGLYWLLQQLCGWTLVNHPHAVVRTVLLLVNGLSFLIYLLLLVRLLEQWGRTDWGRYFVVAAAAFATLLTPFAITLNNHSIGTFCVLLALYGTVRIWEARLGQGGQNSKPGWGWFALVGFSAAFAVCNELPAAAFAAAIFLLLLWWHPRQTLLIGVPAALLPIIAFFVTNYLAMGQWRPAYDEFGTVWYEYEGSHWRKPLPGQVKHGIDWARFKENRLLYAFHVLLGHHGLFSLSPIWLLAIAGMIWGIRIWHQKTRGSSTPNLPESSAQFPPFLYPLSLGITVVVIGFYLVKSDNYGGWSNGLRWLMWLAPLWLLCLLPVADWLADKKWRRGLGYVVLALSVFSVNYETWNPWRHPWLYDLFVALGWPGY